MFKEMGFYLDGILHRKEKANHKCKHNQVQYLLSPDFVQLHHIMCLHKVTLGFAGKIHHRKASFLFPLLGLGI